MAQINVKKDNEEKVLCLHFLISNSPAGEKIARAKNSGGAAGGSAAPELIK